MPLGTIPTRLPKSWRTALSEELSALMQETPVSDNHGRKASVMTPADDPNHDGLAWPRQRRDLSENVETDFLHTEASPQSTFGHKQAAEHGLKAHRGLLTRDEMSTLDTAETRALLEDQLGLVHGMLDTAYPDGPGAITEWQRHIRSTVDQALLQAVEDGAGTHMLSRALGWRIRERPGHNNDCPRMSRTLARARRKRCHQH